MSDIEKILNLKPIPEKEKSKDIFPIFEESMNDLYPQVPDPDVDFMFTNFGDKEPEEPYKKAEKERSDSNRLEKPLKKRALSFTDLSDEQKDIIGKIESTEGRLKKKGWEKWNQADWRDAKRKVRVRSTPEDKKELMDLQHKVMGESVRLRSEALIEMSVFSAIYKAAMRANHADPEKEEGKNEIYKKIDHIVSSCLKDSDLKTSGEKKYDEDDVLGINYKSKEYAIHTHFIKGSKIFLFSLWDKDENRLLLMLCEGYLRESNFLISTAKSRLKAWMKEKNGN